LIDDGTSDAALRCWHDRVIVVVVITTTTAAAATWWRYRRIARCW
jgi:hypothetical protein